MVSFEIYKKEVEVVDSLGNKNVYVLKPLNGRFLPKLYSVIKRLNVLKEGEGDGIASINEDAMGDAHELLLETFKKSYPKEDVGDLDEFCSQNLMKLMEGLIEVNLGKPNEK